jgi:hypothetical protein
MKKCNIPHNPLEPALAGINYPEVQEKYNNTDTEVKYGATSYDCHT